MGMVGKPRGDDGHEAKVATWDALGDMVVGHGGLMSMGMNIHTYGGFASKPNIGYLYPYPYPPMPMGFGWVWVWIVAHGWAWLDVVVRQLLQDVKHM